MLTSSKQYLVVKAMF
jgi:hypothetical protein